MRRNTLEEINASRLAKKPFVVVTDMQTGRQDIVYSESGVMASQYDVDTTAHIRNALINDQCRVIENTGRQLFIHAHNPPLRAIVVGAVHISQELVLLLRQCQYHVIVIDPRESFASQDRFPDTELIVQWPDKCLPDIQIDSRTAIITLTHDPRFDDPALLEALNSDAFYIGALGSRKTQEARNQRLQDQGVDAKQLQRIHGPVGLDINAQSPAEIAIAIMAEITRTLRGNKSDAV